MTSPLSSSEEEFMDAKEGYEPQDNKTSNDDDEDDLVIDGKRVVCLEEDTSHLLLLKKPAPPPAVSPDSKGGFSSTSSSSSSSQRGDSKEPASPPSADDNDNHDKPTTTRTTTPNNNEPTTTTPGTNFSSKRSRNPPNRFTCMYTDEDIDPSKRPRMEEASATTPETHSLPDDEDDNDNDNDNDDNDVEVEAPIGFEPSIGMRIQKDFDGELYYGTVQSGPEVVELPSTDGETSLEWVVLFDDGDQADMSRNELYECRVDEDTTIRSTRRTRVVVTPNRSIHTATNNERNEPTAVVITKKALSNDSDCDYDKAKEALCSLPGMDEEEVVKALTKVGPPYGLQSVTHAIHQAQDAKEWTEPSTGGPFAPVLGLRVRKLFDGRNYFGTVTKDAELKEVPLEVEVEAFTISTPKEVMMWEVTFDDGDIDDMDWNELFRCRADRPTRTAPCRGRRLQSLELFSGRGVVTQELCDRKWKISSIDNCDWSNATVKKDILNMKPEDLEFVPDFIWASPPCHTYSLMAGGKHRSVVQGNFEITNEARKNNFFFVRMAEIMHWAKERHPHLIVVIENPVGLMKKMPLMAELTKSLGLYYTIVHYCAFGRDDKKPTCLWTNDYGLYCSLGEFTCDKKCPYNKGGGVHPIGVRKHGKMFNAAAIPQPLAEEVAEYVNAKFHHDRIRYKEAAPPN